MDVAPPSFRYDEPGGAFNANSGLYVISFTGMWNFSCAVTISFPTASAGTTWLLSLRRTTDNATVAAAVERAVVTGSYNFTMSISCTIKCSQSEIYALYISSSNASSTNVILGGTGTYFSAKIISLSI